MYFYLWVGFSIITFIVTYFWDIYMDWGLLRITNKTNISNKNLRSQKIFLREELSYNNPNFYYFAIILNFILRLAFIINISPNLLN
jgi:hypothetical protein